MLPSLMMIKLQVLSFLLDVIEGTFFDVLRWQLYCVESLHCLGHPVTFTILRVSIKEAGAMLPSRY